MCTVKYPWFPAQKVPTRWRGAWNGIVKNIWVTNGGEGEILYSITTCFALVLIKIRRKRLLGIPFAYLPFYIYFDYIYMYVYMYILYIFITMFTWSVKKRFEKNQLLCNIVYSGFF